MTVLSAIASRRTGALMLAAAAATGALGALAWTSQPAAAPTLSVVAQLEAKEEIRQQLVLYGLLAEGDGYSPRDTDALNEKIFAPDVVSEQYFPDGTPAFPTRHGRDDVKKYTQPARDLSRVGEQHYTLGVYFDEVTATTAKTRSQHMYISVTKNVPGDGCNNSCGGQVKHLQMNNYFDTWAKTRQGWVKVKTVIRSIN